MWTDTTSSGRNVLLRTLHQEDSVSAVSRLDEALALRMSETEIPRAWDPAVMVTQATSPCVCVVARRRGGPDAASAATVVPHREGISPDPLPTDRLASRTATQPSGDNVSLSGALRRQIPLRKIVGLKPSLAQFAVSMSSWRVPKPRESFPASRLPQPKQKPGRLFGVSARWLDRQPHRWGRFSRGGIAVPSRPGAGWSTVVGRARALAQWVSRRDQRPIH